MIKARVIVVALTFAVGAYGKPPVATERVPITDTYHGTSVTEGYRWLENGDDPAVRKWIDSQNAHTQSVLDNLPHVALIRARLTEIMSAETVSYGSVSHRVGRIFAIKRQPPKQQRFLVVLNSLSDTSSERALVDPNQIDPEGATSIDWYVPSPDGSLVAVSMSKGGTESGDVHIFKTADGRRVHEVIRRVNGGTAGGDIAWLPDGSGFFYTRYPRGAERPPVDRDFYQQVYFHKLGTPTEKDRYELGKSLPRIAEIQLDMHDKSGRLLVTVQDGDGGEFAHFLREPDGMWQQFSRFGDRTVQATFGPHDDLYLVSSLNTPRRKIQRVTISDLNSGTPETIVPESGDTIEIGFGGAPTVLVTDTRLYVEYQLGGPSEIRAFGLTGGTAPNPEVQPVSSVGGMLRLKGDDILFYSSSFIDPAGWHRYSPATGSTVKTALASTSPVAFDDIKVVREFAISKDGTKVPVNILMPKTARLDGSNYCVVTGYGGYGISLSPRFRATNRVLFDQGFIYAVANLRGGGEYGEDWHLQGNLANKQKVFDDFAAVVKHLADRGYTAANRTAIRGGSNGGLLMGATMVQHPELVKVVVSHVGLYDMLRVELSPNGAFNVTEFGTVKNPEHFKALYAYSPYHNVKQSTAYPATLFLTGANDPRVDPMQSRKMIARLQSATSSTEPILLRTSFDTGHGGGTPLKERIAQAVDVYAFLFHHLGVDFKEPAR